MSDPLPLFVIMGDCARQFNEDQPLRKEGMVFGAKARLQRDETSPNEGSVIEMGRGQPMFLLSEEEYKTAVQAWGQGLALTISRSTCWTLIPLKPRG